MSSFAVEMEKKLAHYPARTSKHHPETYVGGRLRFLGISSPYLRAAMRDDFSSTGAKDWDQVWHSSDCFEVMSLALAWFGDRRRRELLPKHWQMLKSWAPRIDNWAHADALSGLYAHALEQAPRKVYPTLQAWSRSKNPWLRRLAVVSLLYYSAQRKTVLPLPKILALIEPQLSHEHLYVQKGVGWALREAGNVYPDEVYVFLETHAHALSPAAFSAATEKLSLRRKERLKKIRRAR